MARIVLFLCFTTVAFNAFSQQENVYAFNSDDFVQQKAVSLEGVAKYYWGERISSREDLQKFEGTQGSVTFPGFWSTRGDKFLSKNPFGLVTFHLSLDLPDTVSQYSIKVNSIISAQEIWANGRLLARTGEVGMSKETSEPDFETLILDLPKSHRIEIFWSSLISITGKVGYLGTHLRWKTAFGYELFAASIMILIAAYHLAMFLFYPKEKSYLYFSLAVFLEGGILKPS